MPHNAWHTRFRPCSNYSAKMTDPDTRYLFPVCTWCYRTPGPGWTALLGAPPAACSSRIPYLIENIFQRIKTAFESDGLGGYRPQGNKIFIPVCRNLGRYYICTSKNKFILRHTLRGETFAGRNFRVFAFFGHFRETKSPRKELTSRIAKVYPSRNGQNS